MCEVVVGVSHIDQALDEVGTLYEAEKHLETNREINQLRPSLLPQQSAVCFSWWRSIYLRQSGNVQAFPVLYGGLAGFARPRPFALALGEARPGEDVVIGQVQVCRVHRKLADQLQQAGQAVQQPLQRRTEGKNHTNDDGLQDLTTHIFVWKQTDQIHLHSDYENVYPLIKIPHHSPGFLVFGLQDA